MDLLFRALFGQFISENEWQEVTGQADSIDLFLGIPGGGELETVYRRAWWPSIVRLLITAVPLLVGGLLVLTGLYLLGDSLFNPVSSWASGGEEILMMLVTGGILLYLAMRGLMHNFRGMPHHTPQIVAVLACGIAWVERDAISPTGLTHFLPREQICSVTRQEIFLLVETDRRQVFRFHHGLYDLAFGKRARVAAGELPDIGTLMTCPHCGEKIAPDSTRCLFCMKPVGAKRDAETQ